MYLCIITVSIFSICLIIYIVRVFKMIILDYIEMENTFNNGFFTKNEPFWIHFDAVDTVVLTKKSGDADNLTAYIIRDGEPAQLATNSSCITEVYDGTYKIKLTKYETDADLITISVSSSTPNIYIPPIRIKGRIF